MALTRFRDWHKTAAEYVRWSLSSSYGLATGVDRTWPIEQGSFEAFTPSGQEVENFKWGAGSPVADCIREITTVCSGFLSQPGRVVVFEHHLIRPADPHTYLQPPVRISQDAVYQIAFAGTDPSLLEKQ